MALEGGRQAGRAGELSSWSSTSSRNTSHPWSSRRRATSRSRSRHHSPLQPLTYCLPGRNVIPSRPGTEARFGTSLEIDPVDPIGCELEVRQPLAPISDRRAARRSRGPRMPGEPIGRDPVDAPPDAREPAGDRRGRVRVVAVPDRPLDRLAVARARPNAVQADQNAFRAPPRPSGSWVVRPLDEILERGRKCRFGDLARRIAYEPRTSSIAARMRAAGSAPRAARRRRACRPRTRPGDGMAVGDARGADAPARTSSSVSASSPVARRPQRERQDPHERAVRLRALVRRAGLLGRRPLLDRPQRLVVVVPMSNSSPSGVYAPSRHHASARRPWSSVSNPTSSSESSSASISAPSSLHVPAAGRGCPSRRTGPRRSRRLPELVRHAIASPTR